MLDSEYLLEDLGGGVAQVAPTNTALTDSKA